MTNTTNNAAQPSEDAALERWGFKWQGHDHGTHVRMADGYWTPWHEATAALAAMPAQPIEAWETIASAPKDGTPFDAWVPGAFGGKRMCGLSFNRKGQLRQHGLLTAAELPRWPTHWMPLPAPPTITEAPDQRKEVER